MALNDDAISASGTKISQKSTISLTKSILLHREIHGFLVGGEKRLLFSEINEELCRRGIQRQDIFDKLKSLQMELSEATAEQRDVVAAHLGLSDSTPLGEQYLIRQTDAERLCGAVIRSHKQASDSDITENTFKVQHEIFGKSRGLFIPERYTSSAAECITCIQCRALLSPQDFVRHNHSPPKSQVRHWGLESTRWWRYVYVAKDQANREHFQRLLDELKQRFISTTDMVMTPSPTTATNKTAAAGTKWSGKPSTTTAFVYHQLAALQDAADVVKNKRDQDVPVAAALESFLSLHQQRQMIIDSFREYDMTTPPSSSSKSFIPGTPSSLADVMASAMAAAVAVATSTNNNTASQLSSLFVPPPNVMIPDIFKAVAHEGSFKEKQSNKDSLNCNLDADPSSFIAPKRRRLEDEDIRSYIKSDGTNSSVASFENHRSESVTPSSEALAAVAAIRSQARLQSESASMLALPPRILFSESRPLAVGWNSCHNTDEPDTPVTDDDGETAKINERSKTPLSSNDNVVLKDSSLQRQIDDELSILKTIMTRQVSDFIASHNATHSESLVRTVGQEVDRWFEDGTMDDFQKLRAKHQLMQSRQQQLSSASSSTITPTPKHMSVMGKYVGELQEAKNDLESRVRQLGTELSRSKEEYNSISRRLIEKEREAEEMRHVFNAILVGSSTSSFFTPATTSAVASVMFGASSSKASSGSSQNSEHSSPQDQLTFYQQQQRRALVQMIEEKVKGSLSRDVYFDNYHTPDELNAALAMAASASCNNGRTDATV